MALLVVALLIAGGAAAALVAAQSPATAQEGVVESDDAPESGDAAESDDVAGSAEPTRARPERGAILSGVLDQLVADGTITQAQADAITGAMTDRIATLRGEFGAERGDGGRRGLGFRHHFSDLADALEDGVIDAEELAELGEDHLFNDPEGPAAPYLDDGQLTQEELRELSAELRTQGRRGASSDTDSEDPNATENFFSG